MTLRANSKVSLSQVAHALPVWMCEEPAAEAEAAAEEPAAPSAVATLSSGNAAILETLKGLTLLEAAELIKECETTFRVGKHAKDGKEDEATEE